MRSDTGDIDALVPFKTPEQRKAEQGKVITIWRAIMKM
jgi:hypothetical protein